MRLNIVLQSLFVLVIDYIVAQNCHASDRNAQLHSKEAQTKQRDLKRCKFLPSESDYFCEGVRLA